MSSLFYRNPRILLLTICLILVAGTSSFMVLPRMEDPILARRVARVNTVFPGAEAERVESLVTEKLEEELREINELKELRSFSRVGISTITVELRDDVYDVDTVWSRVRDRIADATPLLPEGALEPEFDETEVKAYAWILALVWDDETDPNYAILRRYAKYFADEIRGVGGTEIVDTFGDPNEEILVELDANELAGRNLTFGEVSRQISLSDSKAAAGQFRGKTNLIMEVDGEFDSLDRIGQIPIQLDDANSFVQLADLAKIRRTIQDPPSSLALIEGKSAVCLGVLVRPEVRIDQWSVEVREVTERFAATLPQGIQIQTVFEQNTYVANRLSELISNLLIGALAVAIVIFVMMGWRSALIVTSALPLSAMIVMSGLHMMSIPIHQMSVTGLIVALGLLIDNAIVMVDEVKVRLEDGLSPVNAVSKSVSHLAIPLLGSTVTTALAFAPIALMPGPAGEFVGSIAVSVVLAISGSFFLAMTVVPSITALVSRVAPDDESSADLKSEWWQDGVVVPWVSRLYARTLEVVFARPILGVMLGLVLPVIGFVQARLLPEQFFPPAFRDQFQVEVDLPAQRSIAETTRLVREMREAMLENDEVESVSWFIGESAPSFYYNLVPRRRNTASYAQAIVQVSGKEASHALIRRLQTDLTRQFTDARVLVRQLEQGPPFDAPVEIRLYGPDIDTLISTGEEIRLSMSKVDDVIHTRSDISESTPKITFQIKEEEARLAGIDYTDIASQLNATLEGAVGGSILEGTEELPVRLRVSNDKRADFDQIASMSIMTNARDGSYNGVPLSAVADVNVVSELSTITHFNGRRMNELQAYLQAGVLPAKAQSRLDRQLAEDGFELPPGYSMDFGGESAKRDESVGNLLTSVGVLVVIMIATLVLSFGSFRMMGIVAVIAALASGLGLGALWLFGYPFGFMAIVGTMGLIGVAINDAIVVLAAIREDDRARDGDRDAMKRVVARSTRHVLATTLTTIAGFIPLLVGGGGFWPPLAITIAGGVGGATILALYFAPALYLMLMCKGCPLASENVESMVQPAVTVPAAMASSV